MGERPIIFSAPMVRALLDGRKTMTRRLAWRCPMEVAERDRATLERRGHLFERRDDGYSYASPPSPWQKVQPGDLLWVREAWRTSLERNAVKARDVPASAPRRYEADDDARRPDRFGLWGRFRASLHLPRHLSRLTLTVTAVKVERLQAISERDAVLEGVYLTRRGEDDDRAPTILFADLWASLHGPASWDANPEVVALSFTVINANIDSPSPGKGTGR